MSIDSPPSQDKANLYIVTITPADFGTLTAKLTKRARDGGMVTLYRAGGVDRQDALIRLRSEILVGESDVSGRRMVAAVEAEIERETGVWVDSGNGVSTGLRGDSAGYSAEGDSWRGSGDLAGCLGDFWRR